MSRVGALLAWLERTSDWISPIVVKEVRQVVRGREFISSFGGSLLAGLLVAFFGAADAVGSEGASGRWTFVALMTCLTVLGLAVVPLGAFSALRNERMEQTLDLITLTALSPRRIVIGKLLAQGVKLAMLFAAVAPFITMSFLLGGIDFVTILVSIGAVFIWSLWACAACLFLSTMLKSRAMSGLVFGGVGIMLFMVFGFGRTIFFFASRGGMPLIMFPLFSSGLGRSQGWWMLAITTSFWLVSLANLVLLAENRLSLPTENRTTALRAGFLVQFGLVLAWVLSYLNDPAAIRMNMVEVLGVVGGLHLAIVAMFAVTEDLVVSRRVFLQMNRPSRWGWLLAMFRSGGGRGAVYVLAQMALLLVAASAFRPGGMMMRWLLAICGYVCFFTGVPTVLFRFFRPEASASVRLRVALLLLLPMSLLLPDILYYVLWRPDALDLKFAARHLVNPMRTLASWDVVELRGWLAIPTFLGLTGLLAYVVLILMGANITAEPTVDRRTSPAAGEPDSAHVVH